MQNYALSVSGGSEDTRVYFSGNYFANDGTLRSTGYNRLGGRVNVTHQVYDGLELRGKLFGRFERRSLEPTDNGLYAAYQGLPWDDPYDADGKLVKGVIGRNWLTRNIRNPLYAQQFNTDKTRNNFFSVDGGLSYDPTNWLTLTSNNRATFDFDRAEAYNDPRTIYGSNTSGDLYNESYYSNLVSTSNLAEARQAFGDHFVQGLAGFEFQRFYDTSNQATGSGIQGFELLDLAANPYSVGGYKSEYAFISGFLQARYNYADRYSLTASVRRDGSSRFGAEDRYGDFYSVGGSWTITNEPFFESAELNFVDQLRLRLGYGLTGNANIGNYAALSLQDYGIKYDGTSGSYPATLGNTGLTWDKQANLNLGVDAQLFDERLSLTLDIYQKQAKDLLQAVPLPYESGLTRGTCGSGLASTQRMERRSGRSSFATKTATSQT